MCSQKTNDEAKAITPYTDLPARQFWANGVRDHTLSTVADVYTPRFPIDGMKIATAGSCFAQHIARTLRAQRFDVIDSEPPPRGLSGQVAQNFGYNLYSARHGNIYTVRRLLQLAQEAVGDYTPADPVWEHKGRFYDALRPMVEPEGLDSPEEVAAQREQHLKAFRDTLSQADLFVFTLGLTEAWVHTSGQVYAVPPGVHVGAYDPKIHSFCNFGFPDILADFMAFRELALSLHPGMKFLVTVSPVPLTATMVDSHVLLATIRSKSILRAVAAHLYETCSDVDYFPSYELLSTPFLGPHRFEPNKRNVRADGVAAAMKTFLDAHGIGTPSARRQPKKAAPVESSEDVVCEEALLEAFAK